MRFFSSVLILGSAVTAIANPLIARQNQPVDVIITALNNAGTRLATYKSLIDSFPSTASNNQQIAAINSINSAAEAAAAEFGTSTLWNTLNSNFKLTASEQQQVANVLTNIVRPYYLGAYNELVPLQPRVKQLGCYDLLNAVYASMSDLNNAFYGAMNYIAVYRVEGNFITGPIYTVYQQMASTLGNSQQAYQVGPYSGFGDEPSDNCQP